MLTRREATAFCLAASTAPVITAVVFGSSRQWLFTAAVAYVAAFAIGAPLFAFLRHRGWPLGRRSGLAAAVAGIVAALSLVALVLVAFPPPGLLADPWPVLSLIGIGAAWGLGLGLVAGLALWCLL